MTYVSNTPTLSVAPLYYLSPTLSVLLPVFSKTTTATLYTLTLTGSLVVLHIHATCWKLEIAFGPQSGPSFSVFGP